MHHTEIVAHQILFLVILLNFLGCITSKEIKKTTSKFFIALLVSDLIMLISLIFEYKFVDLMQENPVYVLPMRIAACNDFISYFSLLTIFLYYVIEYISKKTKISWLYGHVAAVVCIIYAFEWCISIFTGIFFSIENGRFTHGQYYWVAQCGGFFVAGLTLFVIIKHIKDIGIHDALFLMSFEVLPILSIFIRRKYHFFTSQMSMTFSIILTFNFIHLNQVKYILLQETKLKQNKLALSFSQIKPHFIFNILNSLYVLCDKDPSKVKEAIGDFSYYLRNNLDVLEDQSLIPFPQAIENLKHYVNLEKLRFGEDVYVSYDLQETNFKIPPLTLQPLVENSIKHGILRKEAGGTIVISSCCSDKYYKIKIVDDGVGFDTNNLYLDDFSENESELPESLNNKKEHIGIRNVRARIKILCHGDMEIKSEIGKGTSIIISIPENN
ncbi:MAG: histidine kinase [Treponema sp.]|nr:histidine kinase [Treponema sp.]